MAGYKIRTGIGQDSHRFEATGSAKPLILGGFQVPEHAGLTGNSDADVILHAITNAVSGVTGVNILGAVSDDMCRRGITDSAEYLKTALGYLGDGCIEHVSLTLECKTPKIAPISDKIRASVASVLGIHLRDVCLTATSGEELTDFGRGLGIQCFAIVTASFPRN